MSQRWFLTVVGAIIVATIWLRMIPRPAPPTSNGLFAPPVVSTSAELTPESEVSGKGSVQLRRAGTQLEVVATVSLPPPLPGLRYGLWVQSRSGEARRLGDLEEQGWGSYRLAVVQSNTPEVSRVLVTIDDGQPLLPGTVVLRGAVTEATRPLVDPVTR